MTYCNISDIEKRLQRDLTTTEKTMCTELINDAGVIIDAFNHDAELNSKKTVSCRMVVRAMQSSSSVPIGATQGTISALGYSETWNLGSSGASGELYLSKIDKQLLGANNRIGAHSPLEDMTW